MVCSFWSDGDEPMKLDIDADHKHTCMLIVYIKYYL